MPGSFHGIGLASNALRNFQRAMDTTGHNIANVNTRGYSRQRVEITSNDPLAFFSRTWQSLGSGASLTAITRARDQMLAGRAQANAGDLGRSSVLAQRVKDLSQVFGEPGETGVSATLDGFFDSWSAFGSSPNESALRNQVQASGRKLANQIRSSYDQLRQIESRGLADIQAAVARVNELAGGISQLNQAIREQSVGGGNPNDLLDRRDLMLSELSGLIDVQTAAYPDGSVAVYTAGFLLVDSTGTREFPAAANPDAGTLTTSGGQTLFVTTGALAGLMGSVKATREQIAGLDSFADALRAEVNALHRTGSTGFDFFATGVGANGFALSAEVSGSPSAISSGVSGSTGDGALAIQLSSLRDRAVAALGGKTLAAHHADRMSELASQASYLDDSVETSQALGEQIEAQQESISGVSLDEELANMLEYQRSYQAAAQTLKKFDEMTEELLGLLR